MAQVQVARIGIRIGAGRSDRCDRAHAAEGEAGSARARDILSILNLLDNPKSRCKIYME